MSNVTYDWTTEFLDDGNTLRHKMPYGDVTAISSFITHETKVYRNGEIIATYTNGTEQTWDEYGRMLYNIQQSAKQLCLTKTI